MRRDLHFRRHVVVGDGEHSTETFQTKYVYSDVVLVGGGHRVVFEIKGVMAGGGEGYHLGRLFSRDNENCD